MSLVQALRDLAASTGRSQVSSLSIWIKLAAEADWKEKQVKTLAYAMGLFGWLLSRSGSTMLSRRVRLGSHQFSMARRILWLGRIAANWPRLLIAAKEIEFPVRVVSVLGVLLGSLNFIVDDIITLEHVNVIPHGIVTARTWQTAGASWFGTTLCAVILNRWKMTQLAACVTTSTLELQLAQVAELKLLLDFGLNVPYALGAFAVSRIPSGWFAFCGFASGIVGSFKIWVCAHHAANLELHQSMLMGQQLKKSVSSADTTEQAFQLPAAHIPMPPATHTSTKVHTEVVYLRQSLYESSCDLSDEEDETDNSTAAQQRRRLLREDRLAHRKRLLKTVSSPTLQAIRKNVSEVDFVAAHEWRRMLSSNKIAVGETTSSLALEFSLCKTLATTCV